MMTNSNAKLPFTASPAKQNKPPASSRMVMRAACEFLAAPAEAEGESPKRPTFSINAYNGGLVRPSYRFAPMPVVIDLAGLKAAEPISVLLDHWSSDIIGQSTKVSISSNRVDVDGVVTGDPGNPEDPAYKVMLHARNGFQWKASIGIDPTRYERVEAGTTVRVNGNDFAGPCYVLRAGTIEEVSLLSVAADRGTSTKIAARAAEEENMDFHDWLKANGFDPTTLDDKQRDSLLTAFKGEQKKSVEDEPSGDGLAASSDSAFEHIKQKQAIKARLRARGVQFAEQNPDMVDEIERITARAIDDEMNAESFELVLYRLRGERAAPDNRFRRGEMDDPVANARVFEAGLCLAGRLEAIDKSFDERTLDAAQRRWKHGLGLGEFLLNAARANGFTGLSHKDVVPLLKAAFPARLQMAGPSTMDVSGILSNVANKFIIEAFMGTDSSWRSVAAIRSVTDFKTVTSYSLTGDFTYKKVPPGGEIKHGVLGEQAYTNKAETFARMFSLDRRDIVNDDLGAFVSINKRLGRGGALAINEVVWPLFMDNVAFFTEGRGNFMEGAETALSIDALTLAETMFAEQLDPDGNPVAIVPKTLLVPSSLKRLALQIMQSTELRNTTASTIYPTGNTFTGDFGVVSSPYLSTPSITGNSKKKWYLLADPRDMAIIEVCFLNGIDRPTVETAEADFDTMGVKIRGFFDFGAAMQEYRAGVAMNGEAA